MPRLAAWTHDDGDAAAVALLSACFTEAPLAIIHDRMEGIYPSTDMKVGMCIDAMILLQDLLLACAMVDPCGAIFSQKHIQLALVENVDKSFVALKAAELGTCIEDVGEPCRLQAQGAMLAPPHEVRQQRQS